MRAPDRSPRLHDCGTFAAWSYREHLASVLRAAIDDVLGPVNHGEELHRDPRMTTDAPHPDWWRLSAIEAVGLTLAFTHATVEGRSAAAPAQLVAIAGAIVREQDPVDPMDLAQWIKDGRRGLADPTVVPMLRTQQVPRLRRRNTG